MILAKLCGLQTGMDLVVRIMCPPYTVSVGRLQIWFMVHYTHVIDQTVCAMFEYTKVYGL